ncbi:flagellar motor stator protein MotA [Opitutaceae bacterium TAV4]|uniref:motility-associated protein n=1 Tax=Geminisphaera colitermitum TaxID=1148786 RepID=UPI000158C55B|nr:motility-associated protein [Geminisphaera colitermitum]RRJ97494.1 flagellar motor stator protein MotA [Opitutaceae bacterium TAV4]RRK01872.1 flagellar motor stator protein MotA [Opitutaceae bacterium TAV3]
MTILIGALVVLSATLGGFMLAGGNPLVLLHLSEYVVIIGVALGLLIIASPPAVMRDIIRKVGEAIRGRRMSREDYFDLLKLLYELFVLGRRNGLIALEEHVSAPEQSAIFQKYPTFALDAERREFLMNALRPVIDGRIKPDQLEELLGAELRAKAEEAEHPVHLLQLVGDSLPGIGIVAAVLGIINTMASIADGPEVVGLRVAAALTGTLLGVFFAYGFVNPMANRVKLNNITNQQYLRCIMISVVGFAKGLAPITSVEVARRSLNSSVQPGAEELESTLKSMPAPGKT